VRVPNGVHRDRLSLILAVLSKHTGVKPFAVNVHTNVVGGMTMR
jgi:predicted ATP-dependent serine protease